MSDALLLLRLEHRHALELLRLIEQQCTRADDMDLPLLADIAAYFLDYPDQCHHPVEDSVFRHLKARDPEAAAGLGQLVEEHDYIADMARAFAATVADASARPDAMQSRLRSEAAHFVARYKSHMDAEEREFFPLAERTLRADDWARIEFDLFDRADPLYNPAAENRFRLLREKIEIAAGQSMHRAETLRLSRELIALDDLAAFNALMKADDVQYRLHARRGGGYELRHRENVVIDIPACSEARAAWCAWHYLQPHKAAPAH